MSAWQRLWGALEAVPGLCGVAADWRPLLGDEYDLASKYLRPTGGSASAYPCTSPRPCGCAHEVVRHGPGDIVSVCTCEPRECDTSPLSEADVVLYEVNRKALGEAVALALGAVPEHAAAPHVPTTWSIGTYSAYAGFRFPAYLTVQLEADDLRRAVDALVARAEGPFILVAPTRQKFRASFEEPLRRARAQFLALADDFTLDAAGTIAPRRPVDEILAPFRAAVLPAQDASSMAFFPTPAGATWPAVQMRFRDSHTVAVRVKGAHGVFHYAQMGMADSKSGNPTKQWDLLRAFATRYGQIDWSSSSAHRNNQKRKEKLAGNLRDFFRIDGDPFEVTASVAGEGKGRRTRFSLDPDG